MPATEISTDWKDRRVKAGPYPWEPSDVADTLWISNLGDPHTFPDEIEPFQEDSRGGWIFFQPGARILGLMPLGDTLIVQTTAGAYRLTGDTWRDWCLTPIPDDDHA